MDKNNTQGRFSIPSDYPPPTGGAPPINQTSPPPVGNQAPSYLSNNSPASAVSQEATAPSGLGQGQEIVKPTFPSSTPDMSTTLSKGALGANDSTNPPMVNIYSSSQPQQTTGQPSHNAPSYSESGTFPVSSAVQDEYKEFTNTTFGSGSTTPTESNSNVFGNQTNMVSPEPQPQVPALTTDKDISQKTPFLGGNAAFVAQNTQANNPPMTSSAKEQSATVPAEDLSPGSVFQTPVMSTSSMGGSILDSQSIASQDPRRKAEFDALKASQKPPMPKVKIPKKVFLALAGILLFALVAIFVIKLTQTPVAESGKIVWWGVSEDEGYLNELISEFESQRPGIDVVYERQSTTDYRERLTNALASGTGPDIFEIHNSWVPMYYNQLSSAPSSVFNQTEFSQTFYPAAISDLVSAKGIVGVPLKFDVLVLYVNQDILATAVKTPPKTWEELRTMATARGGLTLFGSDNVIVQSGVAMGITENIDHWQELLGLMLLQNNVNLARPTGDRAADAVLYYRGFYTNERVWDKKLPDSTTTFETGRLALYFAPTYRAYEIAQNSPNLRFITVPVPQLPKNSPDIPDVGYATYWFQGVSEKSDRKDTSWQLLKFLSERPQQERISAKAKELGYPERFFPRIDMAPLIQEHSILGAGVKLAPFAKSWYLASDIHDGESGINTQTGAVYANVVNNADDHAKTLRFLDEAAGRIADILGRYGVRVR